MAIDFRPKSKIDFRPAAEPEQRGILQSIVKRPLERLVLEPGRRFGQAIGAAETAPFLSEEQKIRQQQAIEEDEELEIPLLGTFTLRGQKTGVEGAKQIAGEALETGAYLLPASKAASTISSPFKQAAIRGSITGGKAGTAFGAGQALQEGGGFKETLTGAAVGGGIGIGAGTVLPLLPGALQASKGAISKTTSAVKKTAGATKAGVIGVSKIPPRVAARTAEKITKASSKLARIKAAKPHVGEAIKQGIDDQTIEFLKTGSKTDKLQRVKMLNIAKKSVDDFTSFDSAKRLPGETILKGPIKHLMKVANDGRKATAKVMKELGKDKMNIRGVYDTVIGDMRKLGLVIRGDKVIATQGSKVPKSDTTFYQQIFDDLKPNRQGQVLLTPERVHWLRQKWFEVAKSDQTFTNGPTSFARHMRSVLAKTLDTASKGKYLAAQNQTREALTGLGDFVKLLGYKGSLDDLVAKDLKAGETFMRVFGSASDRPTSVLNQVYAMANKYGYKGKEDVMLQLRFADMLENIYGAPSRSIGSQISRSVQANQDPTQVAASSIREAVKWSPYSGIIRHLRATGLLGGREQDVLKAFENLVRGEAGFATFSKPLLPASSLKESLKKISGQTTEASKSVLKNLQDF